MRRIALINQKGGVGKTTTTVNLGAALATMGKRVLVMDLDPQGNMSIHLDRAAGPQVPTTYDVLTGNMPIKDVLRTTDIPNLWVVPSNIDLSGAELELAASFGRESLLKDAIEQWVQDSNGVSPVDYMLFDCPPSLGLLSVNGMVAAGEVIMTLQTEFFALQGMSKLVEVIALLRRRLNPELEIAGILPCLYDTRLKLAREVLAEIRKYFPGQVFERPIGKNVKLAEAPSYGQTIFQYAPKSSGAKDYQALAVEVIAQETSLEESPSAGPFAGGDAMESAGPFAAPKPAEGPAEAPGETRVEAPGAAPRGTEASVAATGASADALDDVPELPETTVELAPAPRPSAARPARPQTPPVRPSVQQPSDLPE